MNTKNFSLYVALLATLTVSPVMLTRVYNLPTKLIFGIFLLFFLSQIIQRKFNSREVLLISYITIVSSLLSFNAIYHEDIILASAPMKIISIGIFVLYVLKRVGLEVFIRSVCALIVALIIFNIVFYILYSLNLLSFSSPFYLEERVVNTFYGFANLSDNLRPGGKTNFRLGGVFDEPGQFSFMIWHVVLLNRLFVKSYKYELILVFGGLITFSLAHFIGIAIYFFFVNSIGKKWIYTVYSRGVVLAVSVLALFFLYDQNPIVKKKVDKVLLDRLSKTYDNGVPNISFESDNILTHRFLYTSRAIDVIKDSPFVGAGIEKYREPALNITDLPAKYGIPISVLLLIPLLFLFFIPEIRRSNSTKILVLILLIMYLQRPSFVQFHNIAALYMMYFLSKKNSVCLK